MDSPPPTPPAPLPAFDTFVAATGAVIRAGGTRACYVPATDTIHVPPHAAFHTGAGYAGTLAHELVQWTGAAHRLARDLSGRFGRRAYAAEELVAELGAAFVLAELGLARTPHPDHAAYCASWAPLLRADPHALATVAAQASRAANYLRGAHAGSGSPSAAPGPWDLTADHVVAARRERLADALAARPRRSAPASVLRRPGPARGDAGRARLRGAGDRPRRAPGRALAELDRIEATVVATHGYPRVRLPAASGAAPNFATDASTITRLLGAGPAARRLCAEFRQRQAASNTAAKASELGATRAQDARTARELSDAALDAGTHIRGLGDEVRRADRGG